ncbi:flavodoxin [Salegentibacter sp. F188]|uniref:Flavodoxin n=1 Tax=Autumnicola patrickiae TaxID=3075591 RepID=A0ABU3E214_9FLAO|nr:flavodoxin [Salegentibacter sp. F188]MDT0690039.1 flavodoxin [Salegentibacter sp. F188]
MKSHLYPALLFFLCLNISCNGKSTSQPQDEETIAQESSNILIVYLSRTNNTEAVAEMIQDFVGGEMVELQLKDPYPENYQEIVDQVDRENKSGYLPPLATEIENIDQYDTIFIGFPTWDMQLPPPMESFLHQYDLSGKTVIPFNTNGGYGIGSSFEDVQQIANESRILEGFSVEGGSERDGVLLAIKDERAREVWEEVKDWLQKIGVSENP